MRPATFDEFHGQESVVNNLRIAVLAAQQRNQILDHVLLSGPAGVGKTTLGATVLPHEMGVPVVTVNCTTVDKPQPLVGTITSVPPGGILFLDEIHAMCTAAREHLLTVLEDNYLSVKIGDPGDERIVRVDIAPMTVVGATTRQGLLDGPLRSRFQNNHTLDTYSVPELAQIIWWHSDKQGINICPAARETIALAARGVARTAVNLLGSARDTALILSKHTDITHDDATATLSRLGYTCLACAGAQPMYLNAMDMRFVQYLAQHRSAGLRTLEAVLNEDSTTIEEVIEPWLLQTGLLARTPVGRRLTAHGAHLLATATKGLR